MILMGPLQLGIFYDHTKSYRIKVNDFCAKQKLDRHGINNLQCTAHYCTKSSLFHIELDVVCHRRRAGLLVGVIIAPCPR